MTQFADFVAMLNSVVAHLQLFERLFAFAFPGFVLGFAGLFRLDAPESPWRLLGFAMAAYAASILTIFSVRLLVIEVGFLLLFREHILLWLGLLKLQVPPKTDQGQQSSREGWFGGSLQQVPEFEFSYQPYRPVTVAKTISAIIRVVVMFMSVGAVVLWAGTFSRGVGLEVIGGFVAGLFVGGLICSRFDGAPKLTGGEVVGA